MSCPSRRRTTATASAAIPAPIESLFARQPGLCGFAVRGLQDIPDNCTRSGDEDELFVSDIGVAPTVGSQQYGEIFEEIATAIAELLAEQPGAGEFLRGRTFARRLH